MARIGIDLRPLLSQHYSGIPEYLVNILATIPTIQNTNVVGWYNQRKQAIISPDITSSMECRVTRIPNKLLNLKLAFTQSTFFDTTFEGCDVVWMPDINFWSPVTNKKLVVTVHDLSYLRFPQFFTWKSRIWTTLSQARKLLITADHLIAVSESTRQDYIELLGVDESRISVVHEGVNASLLTPATQSEKERVVKKYNLPQTFLLFVGTLEPRKNIEAVIATANQLNIPLVIAGKLGWKYMNILKEIKKAKTNIIYLGYIPLEDKAPLYALAKLLLWPSFYEGFGLPVIEAQAQGTPVVTSNTSSLGEVTNGSALLVNPYRIDEIVTSTRLLLDDTVLYEQLKQEGIRNAQRFSWQRAAQQTIEICNNLI